MDPTRNFQRNDLKRPRLGSLDAETHRPPPRPPGGAHSNQIRPDLHSTVGAELYASSSFHPTATSCSIDRLPLDTQNHQQLIPSSSQALGSNLLMPSANWPIPSLPTQTYITGGTHIESHGSFNFYHQTSPAAHDQCLTQLHQHAALNAIHSSSAVDNQGMCMPGTRAFTLQRLQSLVGSTGNDDPDVIWMHGPAGSGKSAIMRTMANALDEQGVLLGSFFFFRSDSQRNTSVPFIPTMASQSIRSCPATQLHIRDAIHSHPNIFSQSIRHQLHRLLETPLKLAAGHEPKWTAQSPLVIVIDGLDECADADRQIEIIKAMLQLASTIRSSTNRRVKILIASRPEKPIQDEFELYEDSLTIIQLDPSDANIDLFYDTRLDEIRRRKGLPESWPSLEQVKWLKEKTSGQYSFAHISMGFLAGGDPVERLKMIENGVGTHGLEPFEALDALYATVFQQIPPEMAENALLLVRTWLVDSNFARRYRTERVEHILSLPPGFTFRLLPYLSSIFNDKSTSAFEPYHASLGDFLNNQGRAGKYSLFLDLPALSTAIVEGMLMLCIDPLPIGKGSPYSWFEDHTELLTFTEILNSRFLLHFSPLPSTTAILDQLPPLLPMMDFYTFGYCNLLLSTLSKPHCLPSLEYHLASNPTYFHTVRKLLDQVYSIQQLRSATYEELEARGDSGLGLFGLLALFTLGCFCYPSRWEDQKRSISAWTIGSNGIGIHAVQVCLEQNILGLKHDTEEPLPLCTLALRLATTREMFSDLDYMFHSQFVGEYALFSRPTEDRPLVPLCLSQTIAMFLDLPMGNTPIQDRILECMACTEHAKLCLQCGACASNLQQTQIVIVYSVMEFLCSRNTLLDDPVVPVIDVQTFIRCYRFQCDVVNVEVQEKYWEPAFVDFSMARVGAHILDKLESEVEGGTDTSILDDLRTIVSSLHERYDVHLPWDERGELEEVNRFSYEAIEDISRDDCWVCSGIRRERRRSPIEFDDSEPDGTESGGEA